MPNELLQGLGQRMGLLDLKLDESKTCQLLFDQRWIVTFSHAVAIGSLILSCPVAGPSSEDSLARPELLAMLKANFVGQSECVLSIAPDHRPYLQRVLALSGTDVSAVHNALESLLNQVETWSERLARPGSSMAKTIENPSDALWAMQRV